MMNPEIAAKQPIKHRDSNIEFFRIISMLLIIAHHYVVNSGLGGVGGVIYFSSMSWRSLFLLCMGAFGKAGINCFVLITGYFMCEAKISLRKFCKLLFEVIFYNIVIGTIFFLSRRVEFSLKALLYMIIPVTDISQDFTSAFLVFYLLIPFLNKLVHSLTEKQHVRLLAVAGFTYVFCSTVPLFNVMMNYVSWFAVLFLIASYIRLYPKKRFSDARLWGRLTALSVLLSLASVVACTWLGTKTGEIMSYRFVSDSNTLLAVLTGLSAFMFFKNIKMKYSPLINAIASTTFGVLLIHANSDAMRQWLWRDTLDNIGHYASWWMPLHAVGSVLCIFAICALIDYLRIRLIDKPFFEWFDKKQAVLTEKLRRMDNKFFEKLSNW